MPSSLFKRSKSTSASEYQLDSKELSHIEQALPTSTHAERVRFLTDRRGKGDSEAAIEKLGNFLEWRKNHINDDLSHLDPWTYASQQAIQIANKGMDARDDASSDVTLPCPVFVKEYNQTSINDKGEEIVTKKKYFHHLPARIDPELADGSTYGLAMAIYIDRVLDRESTEQVSIIIDVRGGRGWANINALYLLPYMQSTSKLLCALHPLRLESCVVFPLAKPAIVFYHAVKPFIGSDTVNKVHLVSGGSGMQAKTPMEGLRKYLDEECILDCEERRSSYFEEE